jgi:hypothetical protein
MLLKVVTVTKLYAVLKLFLKKPLYSFHEHLFYTQKIIAAVEQSGRYLLRTKCLAEALAVHILLNKKRIKNHIEIGFIKCKSRWTAHAWVQVENEILIGGKQSLFYYNLNLQQGLMGLLLNFYKDFEHIIMALTV